MIVSVSAVLGQSVRQNDAVVIIEAMKMQTAIGAPVDGTVQEIHVSPGQSVKPGQKLCTLGSAPISSTRSRGDAEVSRSEQRFSDAPRTGAADGKSKPEIAEEAEIRAAAPSRTLNYGGVRRQGTLT